jgi:hypothetical protein
MQIVFSSNESVNLVLDSTPLAMVYQQIYKHLQHVTIPFRDWDNPFYFDNHTHQDLVKALVLYGNKISLKIDQDLCLAQDQNYFNAIHKIHEKNYRGDPAWLDFHEHIHKCEKQIVTSAKILHIDYREKSGPLEKYFDPNWRHSATTKVRAGEFPPTTFWFDSFWKFLKIPTESKSTEETNKRAPEIYVKRPRALTYIEVVAP